MSASLGRLPRVAHIPRKPASCDLLGGFHTQIMSRPFCGGTAEARFYVKIFVSKVRKHVCGAFCAQLGPSGS
eukprot:scaffold620_cov282-Pinguiococcus_pyrenoidosus.AAC.4